MKNYSSIFNSKPDHLQSSYKSLSNSQINYFSHQNLFKKLSQTTHEKQYFNPLSPSKSKQILHREKPNLFKRPSLNYLKKSIYPTSMQNVCTSSNGLAQIKQYDPQNTFNSVLTEKKNIDYTKKTCYSRNSLNLTSITNLKPSFPARNSINFSNLNNLSHCSTDKKFEQLHTSKSKEKSPFRKSINEKQNIVKFPHTRYASSYSIFTKPPTDVNSKVDSTPRLQNNPRPTKTSIKELQITDFQQEPHFQKLSFAEDKVDSQVNINISSEESIQDVQMTARFNFAQEKHPYPIKALTDTSTSLENNLNETRRRPILLSQFILGPCKGKGRYGRVYFAVEKQTGWICALKQISISAINQMLPQFINELKTQTFLNHPYITKIYGYFVQKDNIYLIMEYMIDGSLYDLIKKSGPVPEPKAAIKLHQVSQALSHMHSYHIIHRDLKPENIVITFGVCKICDFGWAVKCSNKRQTSCGTLDYLSPEMIQGTSYSSSIDLWAMGVLMYEMLVGKPPFYNISAKETRKRIKECQFTFPEMLSKESKSLIECFLRKNPGQRRQMQGILRHPFFQKVQE